ncbi:MAG: tetratricopeptide repeat protein [Phycisphaerae bacterium]
MSDSPQAPTPRHERRAQIQSIVGDFVRRTDAGEPLSADALLESHPNLLPELRTELDKVLLIRRARHRAGSDDGGGGSSDANAAPTIRWNTGSSGLESTPDFALDAGERLPRDDATLHPDTEHLEPADEVAAARPARRPTAPRRALPELEGYQIVDVIGRGGMGMVYDAYQEATGKRVAIKYLLNADEADDADRRRFEREIEIIARLNHPNIVSILDSGLHRDRYYYVMEFVDGKPLDRAVQPGRADTRRTLSLIAGICDVVDYAHQRGVLHRDLKPSNVLVDERGEPRLLDFGLAKTFDPQSKQAKLTLSQPGQIIGTLHYMAPEQARGDLESVSVRSDVYALGAMAYESLTGQLPCRIEGGLRDVLQAIAEVEPRRPSLIRKALGADIDAILLKSLEKRAERRYATAAELAADIRRYLNDEPILARRTGVATRTWRLVRRNPLLSSVIAASLLVVVGVTQYSFSAIADERDQKDAESRKFQGMFTVTVDVLSRVDPITEPEITQVMRAQLREWSAQLAHFDGTPEVEASLRHLFGKAYLAYGEFAHADEHLSRALALRERLFASPNRGTAATKALLGRTRIEQSRAVEAEALLRSALSEQLQLLDVPRLDVAQTQCDLGWALRRQSRYAEALEFYQQSLAAREQLLPENKREYLAETMNNLAQLHVELRQWEPADQLLRRTLELRQEIHGSRHRRTADSVANLGSFLRDRGRLEEAEPLLRRALALRQALLGEHPDTVVSMNLLGLLLREKGAAVEAEALFRETLALRQKLLTPGHAFIGVSMHNLGLALSDLGRLAEAKEQGEAALALWSANGNTDLKQFADAHDQLADVLRQMGDFANATAHCEEALRLKRALFADEPQHRSIGLSLVNAGYIRLDAGDAAGAEPLLRDGLEILERTLGAAHWRTGRARSILGDCLTQLGQFDAARPLLESGYEIIRDAQGPAARRTQEALQRLVEFCDATADAPSAAAYRALLPTGTP